MCGEGVWRRRVEPRLVAPAVPRRVDGQERAACRGDREAWPARCEREARAAPIVEAEQHIVDVRLQLVHLAVDRLEFLVGRDHRCHPCHPWLTCSTAQPLWCAAAWLTRVEARGDRDEAEQQPCSCRRHHGHRVDGTGGLRRSVAESPQPLLVCVQVSAAEKSGLLFQTACVQSARASWKLSAV